METLLQPTPSNTTVLSPLREGRNACSRCLPQLWGYLPKQGAGEAYLSGSKAEDVEHSQERTAPAFFSGFVREAVAARHFQRKRKVVSNHNPKTDVVVHVVRVVPVAVRTAHVPLIYC